MISKRSLGLTFLAVISVGLAGCNKAEQTPANATAEASVVSAVASQSLSASVVQADDSAVSQASAVPVVSAKAPEILCDKVKVNQWVGFDESAENAECKKVESYNIAEYRCSVEKKAFGAEFDAIHLLSQNHSIFIYPSMDKCNQAKEVWESNSPE